MARRSHDDMQELVGAYALDACEHDEAEAFELHLAECPRCRAELQDFRETAALLAHAGTAAPDGLWDRIASELEDAPAGVATMFPISQRGHSSDRVSDRFRRFALASAAVAAAIIGVNTTLLVRQNNQIDQLKGQQTISSLRGLALAAAADPDATVARLTSPQGDFTADAIVGSDGSGYLVNSTLRKLDDAHTYQLWGIAAGDASPVSLGALGTHPEVIAFTAKDLVLHRLAITVEKAGGAAAPTQAPLLAGEVLGRS